MSLSNRLRRRPNKYLRAAKKKKERLRMLLQQRISNSRNLKIRKKKDLILE